MYIHFFKKKISSRALLITLNKARIGLNYTVPFSIPTFLNCISSFFFYVFFLVKLFPWIS